MHGNTGTRHALREIPLEDVQRAFEDSGLSANELARRLRWMRPDQVRAKRALGLTAQRDSRGPVKRQTTTYKRAVQLVKAMGMDPVDYQL